MRLRFALPAAIVLTLLSLAAPAYAEDDSVEQAIEGLNSSNVYVEPGTPGTTDQTASTLQTKLTSDDGIILVMIPESDEPITQIAKEIDDATGNDSIIGLAVGDDVIGYSTALPEGVAADLMVKADNVSTSTVEALGTFARRTHTYESQNPDIFDPPPPPGKPATEDGMAVWPFVLIGLLIAAGIATAVSLKRRSDNQLETVIENVRFNETPDEVRDRINEVLRLRSRIGDQSVVSSLTKTGQYIEDYFRNAQKQPNGEYKGTKGIVRYLPELASVVQRYIKVQDEPELHRAATKRLNEYAQAIKAFERFMLEQVRSANADDEFDYRKAADILNASELRTIRHDESE